MIPETSARQAIALAGQGANVSEIARQLGHDRKTIRIYLNGHRAPGQPRPHADSFAPFAAYLRQRAGDDRHLRGAGLHREITALGYAGSYSAFTRELRGHGITVACRACKPWQPVTPAREQRPAILPFRTAPLAARRSPLTWRARPPRATSRSARSPMSCRRGSPSGPPPATTSPNRGCCSPAAPVPGRAHRHHRNRAPARAPRIRPLSVRLA